MASRRLDRRQGFLISATVHLMILSLLMFEPKRPDAPKPEASPSPGAAEPPRRVVLIRPDVLRQMLRPLPPAAPPTQTIPHQTREPLVALPPALMPSPTPAATPLPSTRDRASMGSYANDRKLLERDRDLASRSAPRGLPGPTSTPPPPGADQSTSGPDEKSAEEVARTERGRALPEGPAQGAIVDGQGTLPQAQRGGGGAPGTRSNPGQRSASGPNQQRSITRSLEELDKRLGEMGEGGMTGAAGVQMGSLFFDPEGADFTGWINHFKNEVYRNWVPPQAVMFGYRGHVDFEFWVERDGRMTDLKMLKSTGTPSLDRAAQNALTGSRLLALPSDYAPRRFRMQVTFTYNEAPQS